MKKKYHPDFFMEYPETATTCTVLDKIQKKLRHAKKHYKDGEEKEFIEHLQKAHSMLEHLIKDLIR